MDVWTIYIYTTLLQFINTAISEDLMIVYNSLESSIAEVVKSTKCTKSLESIRTQTLFSLRYRRLLIIPT